MFRMLGILLCCVHENIFLPVEVKTKIRIITIKLIKYKKKETIISVQNCVGMTHTIFRAVCLVNHLTLNNSYYHGI